MPDAKQRRPEIKIILNKFPKNMLAETFAESGLHHEAIRFMVQATARNRGFNSAIAEDPVLHGVRLMYGTVSI